MQTILTPEAFEAELAAGPYAWPGGYPRYFLCADGGALSFAAAEAERANVLDALRDDDRASGWAVVACDVNWEDPDLTCDHSGDRIESAYAEDDAAPESDGQPDEAQEWADYDPDC